MAKLIDLFRHVWRDHSDRPAHILHIGKTGGTAVHFAIRQDPNYSKKVILHGHETSLLDIPKGESVVFFLRDPISRFISGFYSRKRKGRPRYCSEWSSLEKDVFAVFDTPNELAMSLGDEASINHALARQAMLRVQHLEKYEKWLVSPSYIAERSDDVIFIGFQESLDQDFKRLKSLVGIRANVCLPVDEKTAHRNPATVDRNLDMPARQALNEWYKNDYEIVSLCRERYQEY